jgi:hypothetical protein
LGLRTGWPTFSIGFSRRAFMFGASAAGCKRMLARRTACQAADEIDQIKVEEYLRVDKQASTPSTGACMRVVRGQPAIATTSPPLPSAVDGVLVCLGFILLSWYRYGDLTPYVMWIGA